MPRVIKIAIVILFMAGLGLAFQNCEEQALEHQPGDDVQTQLGTVKHKIDSIVLPQTCEQDSDCKTIAFGSKPCGGPWKYLIYSDLVTDQAELEEYVAEYNAIEKRKNLAENLVSNCSFLMPPQSLVCDEDKTCKSQ